ncbi:MAG: hypothetical protein Q4A58_08055, partial [Fusobacterium sp.]|uniref:hypothetical protein n=1 Tax=Fusobacterium sp. TaxID=68766 RepID=UPI0026DAF81B
FSVIAKEIAGGMKSGSVYTIVGKNLLENTERDNLKDVESSSKTPEAKKGGRLGKEEIRLQNKEIAELGESLDWKHIGGAGRKEEYIEALNKVKGSSKGGNYIDVTLSKNINGKDVTVRINTVDTYKKTGLLTNREAKAADLINIKITREGLNNPELITIPKGTGASNLEDILKQIEKTFRNK